MWKKLSNVDLEIVNHQTIKIDDSVYIIGGYKRSISNDIDKISVFVISRESQCIQLDVGETYVWDCVSGNMKYDDNPMNPVDRYGHSVIVWKQMGILFGGCSNSDYCGPDLYLFGSTKKYSTIIKDSNIIKDKQESWLLVNGIGGNIPMKRDGHSAVLHEDNMFIFGGLVGPETRHYDNKLYQLNLKSWQWTIVYNGDYIEPLGRDFCQLITHGDSLYLFGGRSDNCYQGYSSMDIYDTAVWRFDLRPRSQERSWTCVHTGYGIICECRSESNQIKADYMITAASPLPRRSFMTVTLKNEIILFGGLYETNEYSVHFNDLWSFDTLQNSWRCLSSTIPKEIERPVPLRRGSLTLLNNNCALLIGGLTPHNNSNIDTSKIIGKSFTFSLNSKPNDFNLVKGESVISNTFNSPLITVSFHKIFHKPFYGSISTIQDRDLQSTRQIFLFQRNLSLYQKSLKIVVEKYSWSQLESYHIPSAIIEDIKTTRIYQGPD